MIYLIEFVFPLIILSLILYVFIKDHTKKKEWEAKFKEGMKVYNYKREEEGIIISIKDDKAFVKFFHGNYWRNLDDLVPNDKDII